MRHEFHPEAEQEFADAAHWYEDQSDGLGNRFVAAITDAIHSILADPERYQFITEGIRVFRLDRWPYKIFYEYDPADDRVRIICVMHNKRRPGYWICRYKP
jgi:toxin ParE1/3/4